MNKTSSDVKKQSIQSNTKAIYILGLNSLAVFISLKKIQWDLNFTFNSSPYNQP